jgi:hypothetical protein
MKTVYEKAGQSIRDLVYSVMEQYHPELHQLEPEVAVLIVRKLDEDGEAYHALKCHGAEAAATIRVTSRRRRVLVDFDLEINIDGLTWDSIPERSKLALLDHELTHVVISKDKQGAPRQDDLGHYVFKLRPDDYAINGHFSVMERHGQFALEAQNLQRIHTRMLTALETAARETAQVIAQAQEVAA